MPNHVSPENRAVYEKMKNVVKAESPEITMWRRVACWLIKATRVKAHTRARATAPTPTQPLPPTHKYLILIAFLRQQWFRERASLLRYT